QGDARLDAPRAGVDARGVLPLHRAGPTEGSGRALPIRRGDDRIPRGRARWARSRALPRDVHETHHARARALHGPPPVRRDERTFRRYAGARRVDRVFDLRRATLARMTKKVWIA